MKYNKKEKVNCTSCLSNKVIKKGKKKTKFEIKQKYLCKSCGKRFTYNKLENKSYRPDLILSSISYFNLGNTISETQKLIRKRFKTKVSKASIHSWLNEFKTHYNFYKIRDKIIEEYGKDLIYSKLFRHKGLTYNYKFHKAKLNLQDSEFKNLFNYF